MTQDSLKGTKYGDFPNENFDLSGNFNDIKLVERRSVIDDSKIKMKTKRFEFKTVANRSAIRLVECQSNSKLADTDRWSD